MQFSELGFLAAKVVGELRMLARLPGRTSNSHGDPINVMKKRDTHRPIAPARHSGPPQEKGASACGRRRLVDDVLVSAALDAFGRRAMVSQREAALRFAAAHHPAGAVLPKKRPAEAGLLIFRAAGPDQLDLTLARACCACGCQNMRPARRMVQRCSGSAFCCFGFIRSALCPHCRHCAALSNDGSPALRDHQHRAAATPCTGDHHTPHGRLKSRHVCNDESISAAPRSRARAACCGPAESPCPAAGCGMS